jgi:hypothetical protein
MLDQQPRGRIGAQDLSPDSDCGVRDLADPVEDTVGEISVGSYRWPTASQFGRRWFDDQGAGQIVDLLGAESTIFGGNEHRIGEQIINRRQPGAGRVSPGRHLQRRRLAGKDMQPLAFGMPGQVDQDIDLVGSDAVRQLLV